MYAQTNFFGENCDVRKGGGVFQLNVISVKNTVWRYPYVLIIKYVASNKVATLNLESLIYFELLANNKNQQLQIPLISLLLPFNVLHSVLLSTQCSLASCRMTLNPQHYGYSWIQKIPSL